MTEFTDLSVEAQQPQKSSLELFTESEVFRVSDVYAKKLAADQVVFDDANGVSPDESVNRSLDEPDPEAMVSRSVDEAYKQQRQEVQGAITTSVAEGIPDPDLIVAGAELDNEIVQDSVSVFAAETARLDALVRSGKMRPMEAAREKEAILTRAAYNDISKAQNTAGWTDIGSDIFESFVSFASIKDIADAVTFISGEDQGIIITPGDFSDFLQEFHSQPIERRMEAYPVIRDQLRKMTSFKAFGVTISDENLFTYARIMEALFDPAKQRDAEGEAMFDMALGIADLTPAAIAGAMSMVSKTGNAMRRATNPVATAKASGNDEVAGALNAAVIAGDETAEVALETSKIEAVRDAMPFEAAYDVSKIEGLSAATARALELNANKIDGVVKSVDEMRDDVLVGAFRDADLTGNIEQEQLGELALNNLTVRDHFNRGYQIDNIELVKIEGDKVKLRTTMVHSHQDGDTVTKTITSDMTLTLDAITGNFVENTQGVGSKLSGLLSPVAASRGEFQTAAKSAGLLDDTTTEVVSKLQSLVKDTFSTGGSTKSRKNIDDILVHGDDVEINPVTGETGKVYTEAELRAGINVKGRTIKLTTDAELEGYYKGIQLGKTFQYLRDKVARRQLELEGVKGMRIGNHTGLMAPLKGAASVNAKIKASGGTLRVYDPLQGKMINLTKEAADELLTTGTRRVMEMRNPGRIDKIGVDIADAVDNEWIGFVIADINKMDALPRRVLHSKAAYVPKVSNHTRFFVKQGVRGLVNGQAKSVQSITQRTFSSKIEAEQFAKEMREQAVSRGDLTEDAAKFDIEVVDRNSLSAVERVELPIDGSKGLYTGARATHDIMHGMQGTQQAERVSAFEAFSRNADSLGQYISRNEWRLGEEKRWLNTAQEMLGKEAPGSFFGKVPNTDKGQMLEKMREQIKVWNGMPTREESVWNATVQLAHDKMPAKLGSIKPWTAALADKDPLDAARTGTFHLLLGSFNPIQLFVQAMGATVAISRNPVHAVAALPDAIRMSIAATVNAGSPSKARAVAKQLGIGDTWDELVKTGLLTSTRTNADLKAAQRGYGMVGRGKNALGSTSMAFYTGGERFNRIMSWSTSRQKIAGRAKVLTRAQRQDILKDARKSMLELSSANKAMWQGGAGTGFTRQVMGTALQFQQVTAKTLEKMLLSEKAGGFTAGESLRVLLGQAALLGSAGIVGSSLMTEVGKEFGAELPEGAETWYNNGAVGLAFIAAMGEGADELSIANRASLVTQTQEFFHSVAEDGVPAGAFVGLMGRTFEAGVQALSAASLVGHGRELTLSDAGIVAEMLLKIPSSTRNLLLAKHLQNTGLLRTAKGTLVSQPDLDPTTLLLMKMGFRHEDFNDAWVIGNANMERQDEDEAVANVVVGYMESIAKGGDPENINVVMDWLRDQYKDNPQRAKSIMKRAMTQVSAKNPGTKARNIQRFTRALAEGFVDEALVASESGNINVLEEGK